MLGAIPYVVPPEKTFEFGREIPLLGDHLTIGVFGILVAPWMLLQFIEAVGGSPGASLNIVWVFAVTAGLGVGAALLAGLRYGLLLASLSVIVSWSALWDKILSDGIGQHFGIYRGLLIILAGLLFAAAFAAWRLNPVEGRGRANEIVTGAAVSAAS